MNALCTNVIRVCFALPGFHRVDRGAETALEAVARQLALRPDFAVTVIGGGAARKGEPYAFRHAGVVPRERFEGWPRFPPLRNEYRWEELSFARTLRHAFRPGDFDVTVTCSYPFVNWRLRAGRRQGRPRHVFVTQNGDWPVQRRNAEYRFFSCDGLVCTNPAYFERNGSVWPSILIPNGIDATRFRPGPADRSAFGVPASARVILMVSALIPSKRVLEGLRAIARLPDTFLFLLGDGPLRAEVDALAAAVLPDRFRRLTVGMDRMPEVYRCADAFLHMSRDEAFGNVYAEALASGLPVVAHDYPTTRWILAPPGGPRPEDFAWLVDTTDETALANALAAALRAPRTQAATRHASAALRFAWPVIGQQYATFLTEVAGT